MPGISDRVAGMSFTGARQILESAPDDAIDLAAGVPTFPTPDHICDAAREAIDTGDAHRYTLTRGRRPLRDAICEKHARDDGVDVDPANVVVTSGSSEALHLAFEAHVGPGDEVILSDPAFGFYERLTALAGGRPQPVGLREDLTLDPATVESAITDDTVAFVVNSPANPTGAVQSEADMHEFARIAAEHNVLCVSDESYEPIVFDGGHHSPLRFDESGSVVAVNSFSKSYGMTGWRMGWIVADEDRIDHLLKVHQSIQICASVPAQYAATAALEGPQDVVDEITSALKSRRDVLVDGLEDAGLDAPTPRGAFYALPSVPEGWVEAVIERGVLVVPGEAYGDNGHGRARIAFTRRPEELKRAVEVMREATGETAGT